MDENQDQEVQSSQVSPEETLQGEKEEKFDVKAEIISWIKVVVFAVILAFILGKFVLMNAYIPSGSMENTLMEQDHIMGFRLAYLFSEPKRYDVVMFKYPDDESKDYIKRVIGLPGETVTIKGGKVYIDGSDVPLDEPYLKEEPFEFSDISNGTYEVPEGCYFMLGDNRNNSKDSRLWVNKYVKKDKILAKAIFRFLPLNKISIIKSDY